MAVDVVGYSRLMGEDEAGTAKAVRMSIAKRRLRSSRVSAAGSSKTMGDGVLLEFPPWRRRRRMRGYDPEHDGRAQRRYAWRREADRLSHWRPSRRRADRRAMMNIGARGVNIAARGSRAYCGTSPVESQYPGPSMIRSAGSLLSVSEPSVCKN